MAHEKLISAIIVALFSIGLETAAGGTWFEIAKIGDTLRKEMSENLSIEDQADAEKVFSFARKHISGLGRSEAAAGGEFLSAWDKIIHHSDNCNESSLLYIATITSWQPSPSNSMRTLTEATRKYASKCLTLDYIANKIESETRGSGCFSISCFKTKSVKFIDDQLIADYWSDNPEDGQFMAIEGLKSAKALAKAILRDPKQNADDFKFLKDVHAYLKEHLYKPCFNYERAFREVMDRIKHAMVYFEGGFEKLVSSLDEGTQKVFFRYELCSDIGTKTNDVRISRKVMSRLQPYRRSVFV